MKATVLIVEDEEKLRRVIELGHEHRLKPAVLTFDPHPTRVVAPHRAPRP